MSAITIVALQDPIAIVHIPNASSDANSTRLYWSLEHAGSVSSEFFNITSNCIEIAIFASVDLVNSHWTDSTLDPNVKISLSTWRVFEISSGDQGDTANYDSPHLRHVSAPLAKAGITILYQSSYFTDFLLVKEADFEKTSAIFARQGWQVDPNTPSEPSRRRSQLLSPVSAAYSDGPSISPTTSTTSDAPPPDDYSHPPEITVLSPPLACIGFSRTAEKITFEKIRQLIIWPRRAEVSWRRRSSGDATVDGHLYPSPTFDGDNHSDACNANDTHDGVVGVGVNGFHAQAARHDRPFLSYTRTADGSSLISGLRILRDMFNGKDEGELLDLGNEVFDNGDLWGSSDESERTGWGSDGESSSSDDDEDHEETPFTDMEQDEARDDSSDVDPCRDSLDTVKDQDQPEKPCRRSPPIDDLPRTPPPTAGHPFHHETPSRGGVRRRPFSLPVTPRDSPINDITRRTDGIEINWSSTSTSAGTSGRLDSDHAGSSRRKKAKAAGRVSWIEASPQTSFFDREEFESIRKGGSDKGRKRCLQLDLRGVADDTGKREDGVYHMDKSGLVTLFSDLLNSGDIKMLYSSTFHTANILVDAGDVRRAKKLLRYGRAQG